MPKDNTYTIPLVAKPIWLQQPEETPEQYAAFMEWVNEPMYKAPAKITQSAGLTHWVIYRCRWQERADAYHEDVNKRLSMGVSQAYERLEVTSIEKAAELLEGGITEETEHRTKNSDGSYTVKRTKTRLPSERLTAQLLQGIRDKANESAGIDFAEVLRAMVQDTETRGDASTDSGLEEQPSET